ncbi:replicase [Entoleuca gammaflexivirus 1]|uniref:Replicase n=1 Tax=Entoleuca gammaflexivirus 1 TaxID=2086641 RepID=A0AAD0GUS6_9VIRU|nr:replicase [Entoleuca gammaflexivirus 1]AVD68667.2 replicase [Entoleuca gammaflexivirus 1]
MAANPLTVLSGNLTASEHVFNVQTDYLAQYRALRQVVSGYSQHQLPKCARTHLQSIGICYDPDAPGTHSHPLSKTIENYVLNVVVPPILRNMEYDVAFMKPAKFARLMLAAPPSQNHDSALINRCVTDRDRLRYGLDCPTDPFPEVTSRVLFVHDAFHFFTPSDVLTLFRSSPSLDLVVASIIIPPGILFNRSRGSTPMYDYRTEGNVLHYAPDGEWSQSYSQPLDCSWLLLTKFVEDLELHISITTTFQADASFVITLQRGHSLQHSTTFCVVPDKTILPSSPLLPLQEPVPHVNSAAAHFLISQYSNCVSAPTKVQLRARLRMWASDHPEHHLGPDEYETLASAARDLIKHGDAIGTGGLPVLSFHHLLTRRGPLGFLRGVIQAAPRLLLSANTGEHGLLPATTMTHHIPVYLNGRHTNSVLFGGPAPARGIREYRAALISLILKPQATSDSTPHIPLSGMGNAWSLSPRIARTLLRLVLIYASSEVPLSRMVSLLVKSLRRALKNLLTNPKRSIKTLLFIAQCSALFSLLAAALAATKELLIEAAVAKIAQGLRAVWYPILASSPAAQSLDFALHSFLAPSHGSLAFQTDPTLHANCSRNNPFGSRETTSEHDTTDDASSQAPDANPPSQPYRAPTCEDAEDDSTPPSRPSSPSPPPTAEAPTPTAIPRSARRVTPVRRNPTSIDVVIGGPNDAPDRFRWGVSFPPGCTLNLTLLEPLHPYLIATWVCEGFVRQVNIPDEYTHLVPFDQLDEVVTSVSSSNGITLTFPRILPYPADDVPCRNYTTEFINCPAATYNAISKDRIMIIDCEDPMAYLAHHSAILDANAIAYCAHPEFAALYRIPARCDDTLLEQLRTQLNPLPPQDLASGSASSASFRSCSPSPVVLSGSSSASLPTQNTCLIDSLSRATGTSRHAVFSAITQGWRQEKINEYLAKPFPLDDVDLAHYCKVTHHYCTVNSSLGNFNFGSHSDTRISLCHRPGHWFNADRPQRALINSGRRSRAPPHPSFSKSLFELFWSYSRPFRPNISRARVSYAAMESRSLGALIPNTPSHMANLRSLCKSAPTRTTPTVEVMGRMGDPGTGKSYEVLMLIKAWMHSPLPNSKCTIVVNSNDLRHDIIKKLELTDDQKFMVKTWERAIVEPCESIVLMDDIGDIPPITDLFLLAHPNVRTLCFTGDPAQVVRELSTDVPNHKKCKNGIDLLSTHAGCYFREGHRLPRDVARAMGLTTRSTQPGSLKAAYTRRGDHIMLSNGAASLARELGIQAHSAGSVQGLSFEGPCVINLNKMAKHMNDRTAYTILTRSKGDCLISDDNGSLVSHLNNRCPILTGAVSYCTTGDNQTLLRAVRDHRIKYTPPQLADPLRMPGKAPRSVEQLSPPKLSGTGFGDVISKAILGMSTFTPAMATVESRYTPSSNFHPDALPNAISEVPSLALTQVPMAATSFLEDMPRTRRAAASIDHSNQLPFVLPGDLTAFSPREMFRDLSVCSQVVEMVWTNPAIYKREFRFNGLVTQQVAEDDYATAVFLRHRRGDSALEKWTFKERHVKPSRPTTTYLGGGRALFNAWMHVYNPKPIPFSEDMYERAVEESQAALTDKGIKSLKNISYRNDPSLDPAKAETFLKSQDITKLGTAFRQAKKGQMITGFITHVNTTFAPMARYLYSAFRTSLPPSILLLNGVTLDDQERWFNSHWDWAQPCYEDDYTGFDGTQNEDFLAFQVLLMGWYGIPTNIIETYVLWVTHLRDALGECGVWIASGFIPTWLFNTADNMAFQALKHALTTHTWSPSDVARSFSGDDSTHNELVTVRPLFARLEHQFKLVSTGTHSDIPHFCGTVNLPGASFCDPTLLLTRILFRLRRGNLASCALSYSEHCARLQSKYEECSWRLTERERYCHATSLRLLRLQLRISGIPLVGSFLTKLLSHNYNLLISFA